eukprot:scaffold52231_cov72-Phaeocystis_antarctica.AAC.1
MVIGTTENSHNIIQEARILVIQMRSRDMWELRGPPTEMSDLEQPAYGPSDNETPEEDDTITAEDTNAENDDWEAEFAADPEAEAQLRQ